MGIIFDVEDSNYDEEWYQHYYACKHCNAYFMVDFGFPKFCPICGHKIKTIKCGQTYISNFKEVNNDN